MFNLYWRELFRWRNKVNIYEGYVYMCLAVGNIICGILCGCVHVLCLRCMYVCMHVVCMCKCLPVLHTVCDRVHPRVLFEPWLLSSAQYAWVYIFRLFPQNERVRMLTRALLGLWIFHRLLGGGVWTPPPHDLGSWSPLEKNERQRSKAREKSFRNHFGHFLAQVKIEVSRSQNSKIFQNGFSTIKSLFLKVEQRFWYHRVCHVKARRTILYYDFERSRSKFDLRSSQAKVTWWPKWVILHISRFVWPIRTYWHQSHVSISFWSKVIGKLRLVTSGDLKWPFEGKAMQIFSQIVPNCPIRYDSTQIGLRQSKYNRVDFLPIDL